jgi:hypothetical protein
MSLWTQPRLLLRHNKALGRRPSEVDPRWSINSPRERTNIGFEGNNEPFVFELRGLYAAPWWRAGTVSICTTFVKEMVWKPDKILRRGQQGNISIFQRRTRSLLRDEMSKGRCTNLPKQKLPVKSDASSQHNNLGICISIFPVQTEIRD